VTPPTSGLYPWLATVALLAVCALLWGGVVTFRRGDRQKGVLMGVAALVLLGNVLIWSV